MCMYMYLCVSVCLHVYICMYVHVCVCEYASYVRVRTACVYVSLRMCLCCVHMHVCVCVYGVLCGLHVSYVPFR